MVLRAKANAPPPRTSASVTTTAPTTSSRLMNGSGNNGGNNTTHKLKRSLALSNATAFKLTGGGSCTGAGVGGGGGSSSPVVKTEREKKIVEKQAANGKTAGGKAMTTTTTTTFRSRSTSAIVPESCLRPQTLNVHRETPTDQTKIFFGEVLTAWRAKARCNVVPAERTQELFHELSFHPNEKQISEMLQTAKMLARRSSSQPNGLTFGEFCVLAADLKRFRTANFSSPICGKVNALHTAHHHEELTAKSISSNCSSHHGNELRSIKSLSNVEDCQKKAAKVGGTDTSAPVEVFLGGSCNPTTWRADVAIPALDELGISFYNPQVSDWTPDLIELEHRAKEKARVLFFVMDSETRASAGAIEAAHIAGQNCKQLVLVLHPYKPNQYILNELISKQEYIDLMRNQLILKELVTRRGLPVLDDIPSGLQRTKEILAGIRDPPSNIASILVVVRGAFDRVNPVNDVITVDKCQRALLYLGYAQSLLKLDNLNKIIASQRESLDSLRKRHSTKQCAQSSNATTITTTTTTRNTAVAGSGSSSSSGLSSSSSSSLVASPSSSSSSYVKTGRTNPQTAESSGKPLSASDGSIDFDLFCVICAYLSVLQQEIQESGCISPIKGTNVPPPPVYFTNMQGDESFAISYFSSKNISRTSSNTSVPGSSDGERQSVNDLLSRSRDSGTSSPQPQTQPMEPLKSRSGSQLGKQKTQILVNIESIETTEITTTTIAANAPPPVPTTGQPPQPPQPPHPTTTMTSLSMESNTTEEESDSNDSVFSSSSSINSVNCEPLSFSTVDFRDVYLGGSCYLRTRWRQDIAIPYLKSKGVSYHLPALHESIKSTQFALAEKAPEPDRRAVGSQENSMIRTRRKYRDAHFEAEEEITVSEDTYSWSLPPMRPSFYNPALLDSSRVLLFVITNETRSLAPMTLAAHCIGLMYNVVLAVQMLPNDCVISNEKLTPAAIKDYNRGRSYLIDLAKRQGVPVFTDLKKALECTVDKIKSCTSRNIRCD